MSTTHDDFIPARQAPYAVAKRVHVRDAARHFAAGGGVCVSQYGEQLAFDVYPSTTVNWPTHTSWDELVGMVDAWRNRYPNQRYYIVTDVTA